MTMGYNHHGLHRAKVDVLAKVLGEILDWLDILDIEVVGSDKSDSKGVVSLIVEGKRIPLDAEKVMFEISPSENGIEFKTIKVY